MGISKLTDPDEIAALDVNVKFYNNGRVVVDTEITPAYCLACRNQIGGMYHYTGSRHGRVGLIICDVCRAEIWCTDDEGYRHQIYMGIGDYFNRFKHAKEEFDVSNRKLTVDFSKLYLLSEPVFASLADKGFDLSGLDAYTQLSSIVDYIQDQYNQVIPDLQLFVDAKFKRVPPVVLEWYQLLYTLEIGEFMLIE
ncbi:hypothetical protein [Paenibacillus tuaregi]|uniref:hypothetical protein n=1 Tax=Paenibacillus tuaregi TaxID=1816681 RepID=UPI000838AC23|nr:hypothetical protein [Paenibacillus tuaregi]